VAVRPDQKTAAVLVEGGGYPLPTLPIVIVDLASGSVKTAIQSRENQRRSERPALLEGRRPFLFLAGQRPRGGRQRRGGRHALAANSYRDRCQPGFGE